MREQTRVEKNNAARRIDCYKLFPEDKSTLENSPMWFFARCSVFASYSNANWTHIVQPTRLAMLAIKSGQNLEVRTHYTLLAIRSCSIRHMLHQAVRKTLTVRPQAQQQLCTARSYFVDRFCKIIVDKEKGRVRVCHTLGLQGKASEIRGK